ncbi:MAG: zinc-binding dehydrogenase, partial [Clostridia bacterium]|nr:zinc-binding dehydrogenase [Clostridia bacterium]
DETRIKRAKKIFSAEKAAEDGIELIYTTESDAEKLKALIAGAGFDDVFVYAPVASVVETADRILAFDGCLNFFAGPTDKTFSAKFNFYDVHYARKHVVGTSGSLVEDMKGIIEYIGKKRIDPAVMVTHIGGIDSAIDTTLNLPKIPGGKKLIYTHINMPLTAIEEFAEKGKTDARFRKLAEIVKKNNGLWCAEAENYLLDNFQ